MKPKRIPPPAKIVFSFVLTSVIWLYPASAADANANAQTLCSSPPPPPAVYRTSEYKVILDPAVKRWVQFQELSRDWKAKRGASSSLADMSMLEPYQKIIGMGPDAVPLILAQLRAEGSEPDQWFWALRILTGINPVKLEDQGDFRAMARAWIDWGSEQERAEYVG